MTEKEQVQHAFSSLDMTPDARKAVQQMKRIGEVAATTGLKESQIGLYIKENMIHPAADAARHYKAGYLLGGEVDQLRAVACLRVYQFGLDEIKYLTVCDQETDAFLEKKSEQTMVLYEANAEILSAIAILQSHAPESKELEKLRKKLNKFDFIPKARDYKPSFFEKHKNMIILSILLGIMLAALFGRLYGLPARVMAVFVFLGLGALLSIGGGIVYLIRRKTPKKYTNHGTGTIMKVTVQTGFDSTFAMGRSIVPGSGFREQGQGGVWQFVFMFWNEIRPDHYYPIIRFQKDGSDRIGTLRMGGFKNTWKEGEKIRISWAEEDNGIVYPEDTLYLVKKGVLALTVGLLLAGLFFWKIGPVYRAANYMYGPAITDFHDIWTGIEDVYQGTEMVNEKEIILEYELYTGSKDYTIHCSAGDIIYLESDSGSEFESMRLRRGLNEYPHFQSGVKFAYGYLTLLGYDEIEKDRLLSAYSADVDGDYVIHTDAYKASGRFHAWVEKGSEIAASAGKALKLLTDSESYVLEYKYTTENPELPPLTLQIYVDKGRCYQRTEIAGKAWTEGPAMEAIPAGLQEIQKQADNLICHGEKYSDCLILNESFYCCLTGEALDDIKENQIFAFETMMENGPKEYRDEFARQLEFCQASDYEYGSLEIEIDKETGRAKSFSYSINYEEGPGEEPQSGNVTCEVEVLSDVDAAAEIDRMLAER